MSELLDNIDKLHTTELGVKRISTNLRLGSVDVVDWCKSKVLAPNAIINRQGKNWYVVVDDVNITINGHSYTIITAHKI